VFGDFLSLYIFLVNLSCILLVICPDKKNNFRLLIN